jgi:hypothetical protein
MEGGVEVQIRVFLTSVLDGSEWSASRPGRVILVQRAPGTNYIGGWVGPRSGLNAMEKRTISCPYRESNTNSSASQSVVRRYTD